MQVIITAVGPDTVWVPENALHVQSREWVEYFTGPCGQTRQVAPWLGPLLEPSESDLKWIFRL
jgi:hypothetical protein